MLALACILLLDKQSFRIRRKEILPLLLLAFLYDCSAVFLFWGYKFMSSGVATTIHFMYPVLTTLIMMIFFCEKKSPWRIAAIALAVSGVFFLSHGDTTGTGVGVQAIPDRITLGNLVMLALVPTVISNLALVRAIKNIGSTLTSVLGAMEPVTAVCVGILIFGEPFTQSIALGIGLIISAVTVIILKK